MHRYFSWLRHKITLIILVLVLLIGVGVWWSIHHAHSHNSTSANTSKCPATPQFKSILPSDTSIDSLGGWKPLCPPNSTPTYVYADSIHGVAISVSEQPLPSSLRDNPSSQIADLAQKSDYSDVIDTGSTNVYVGTSAKGPQSAILTKANLLILIKSNSKISDNNWSQYVQSLN